MKVPVSASKNWRNSSVAVAEELKRRLNADTLTVQGVHRDLGRE